jgi:hypothetical protein
MAAMMAATATRRLAAIATIALFVAASVQGFMNVAQNIASLETGWQWVMTGAQAAYSALGLVAALALWRRPPLAARLSLVWGAAVLLALAAIPPAWVPEESSAWWRYAGIGAAIAGMGIGGTFLGARR